MALVGRPPTPCSTSSELVDALAQKWSDGATSTEIGTFLGVSTQAAGTFISNLRRYFPDRFPRRREKTLQRYSSIIRMLRAVQDERPDPRIAEALKWLTQKANKHRNKKDT